MLLVSCVQRPALEFGRGLDVPYVDTPPAVVAAMLRMAGLGKDDFLIDLGSGDGRIVIAAARQGAHGIGYDLDPERIGEARENARTAGVSERTEFVQQDLVRAPIHRATVVTLYLVPLVISRLTPRLAGELAPGTRVVSHSFPISSWPLVQKLEVEGRTLYLYTVPARRPLPTQ